MIEERPRLLVTGAAGQVAALILPALRVEYRLLLVDVAPQESDGDDEIIRSDVCEVERMTEACKGVAGVVHLAGTASEGDFLSSLVPNNLIGTWSIFEAAVRAGVSHVVFASTGQTMRAYPLEADVTVDMPPRPASIYACTKLFGEAIARYHADQHSLCVVCLRIGWVVPADSPLFNTNSHLPDLWCGPEDLAALVLAALRSDVRFATVLAVSPPATDRFDVSNPYGWQPTQVPRGPRSGSAILGRIRRIRGRLRRESS